MHNNKYLSICFNKASNDCLLFSEQQQTDEKKSMHSLAFGHSMVKWRRKLIETHTKNEQNKLKQRKMIKYTYYIENVNGMTKTLNFY